MNQYEILKKWQKTIRKWTTIFSIAWIIIIIWFSILWISLISNNKYSIYFIALIMCLLPIIIILSFILVIEKNFWWIEERRWYIKIINQ